MSRICTIIALVAAYAQLNPGKSLPHYICVLLAISLLAIFTALSGKHRRKRGAAFAAGAKECKHLLEPTAPCIMLGTLLDSFELLFAKAAHVVLLAPTGHGKTDSILFCTVLAHLERIRRGLSPDPHAIIILDPKGEVRDRTLAERSKLGPCFTISLNDDSDFWDPMPWIALDRTLAKAVVDELLPMAEYNFFTERGRALATAALQWGIESNQTFVECWDWLCGVNREGLEIVAETTTDASTGALLRSILAAEGQTLSGIIATAASAITLTHGARRLFSRAGAMAPSLIPDDASFTIYMMFSPLQLAAQAPIFRMLLYCLLARRLRAFDPKASPLQLLLDEASSLGKVGWLENLAAITRGYKIQTLFAFQGIEQIYQLYGQHQTLTTHFGAVLFTAANDGPTARLLSDTLGEYEELRRTVSVSSGGHGSRTTSDQLEKAPLLLPSQIMAMTRFTACVISPPDPPVRIKLQPFPFYKKLWKLSA